MGIEQVDKALEGEGGVRQKKKMPEIKIRGT